MAMLKNRISFLEKKRVASKPQIPPIFIVIEEDGELTASQQIEVAQAEQQGRDVIFFRIV